MHLKPSMDFPPSCAESRFKKGKWAVSCPPDATGCKTRAMRLAQKYGKFSRREDAYIMTQKNALKVAYEFGAGMDAPFIRDDSRDVAMFFKKLGSK